MAKLTSSAAGGFMDMKREMDEWFTRQMEKWLQNMSLPTHEEVDGLREMVAKLRTEQEEMKARLERLETAQLKGESE